jgi:hypothetical protein
MEYTTLSPKSTRSKKNVGDIVAITRLGVGDKVAIGTSKTGVVIARMPANPQTKKGGSTTIKWKGGDELRYDWDDYSEMTVAWMGEVVL